MSEKSGMTKKTLFILAFSSLIVFTVLGWGSLEYFGPVPLNESLALGFSLPVQVAWGLILGCLVGASAWLLIGFPFFKGTLDFFVGIIGPWRLNLLEIFLVSCCAGIGEEILFRGAIQPHLGIVATSVLFVVIHGYINPFNGPMTVYGIFMIIAICLLGWVAVEVGLVAAMVAHTTIDVILLYLLSKAYISSAEEVPPE